MRIGEYVHKFGFNPDIDTTSDPEDIWDGGALYEWPTTAGGMTIGSTSAADSSTGTNARTVQVEGCSTAYRPLSELATLGTTRVSLTQSYWRVFRAYVVGVGSSGVNASAITVEQSTNVVAQISAGRGQTLMAIYTALDLSTAVHATAPYLTSWYASMGRQASASYAELALLMRKPNEAIRTHDIRTVASAGNSNMVVDRDIWQQLTPGTDIWVRAETVSANDTAVSAGFGIAYSDPGRLT